MYDPTNTVREIASMMLYPTNNPNLFTYDGRTFDVARAAQGIINGEAGCAADVVCVMRHGPWWS